VQITKQKHKKYDKAKQNYSSKLHNSSIAEYKVFQMVEMPDKEFKSLVLKMIHDLKENSKEQMNKVKRSIQGMNEKFSKETVILEE
jgi:hypothetical protein